MIRVAQGYYTHFGKNEADNSWYTIGGVKLNGRPTEKGVYIIDGKKVIIK